MFFKVIAILLALLYVLMFIVLLIDSIKRRNSENIIWAVICLLLSPLVIPFIFWVASLLIKLFN